MNKDREIKRYIKNNELDLERIINEYSSYIAIIINNMASTNLRLFLKCFLYYGKINTN